MKRHFPVWIYNTVIIYNLLWWLYYYGTYAWLTYSYWFSVLTMEMDQDFICKQLDSICLSVLSQVTPPPETLQPQWWQPRWGEDGLSLTKSLASRRGSCKGHDACLQCLRVFPLEFPRGLQSPSICLPPCGRVASFPGSPRVRTKNGKERVKTYHGETLVCLWMKVHCLMCEQYIINGAFLSATAYMYLLS